MPAVSAHQQQLIQPSINIQLFLFTFTKLPVPLQGFFLILQSSYLQLICLHFILHYITSSWLWFLKTSLFAAASQDAAGQMALFAGVNTASAGAIILLQLLATVSLGRLILVHY